MNDLHMSQRLAGRRRRRLFSLATILLSLPIAFALWLPTVACGCGNIMTRQAETISKLKRLALGAAMYDEDNEGRFPPGMGSSSAVKPFLSPYIEDEFNFVDAAKVRGPYLGNKRLAGVLLSQVESPDRALMFFDSADERDGRRGARFVDGHAALCKGEDVISALIDRGYVMEHFVPAPGGKSR